MRLVDEYRPIKNMNKFNYGVLRLFLKKLARICLSASKISYSTYLLEMFCVFQSYMGNAINNILPAVNINIRNKIKMNYTNIQECLNFDTENLYV